MIRLSIALFICSLALSSCSESGKESNEETIAVESKEAAIEPKIQVSEPGLFRNYLDQFEDISAYLGDMELFCFSLEYDHPRMQVPALPVEFLSLIDTASRRLDFCAPHLQENREYKALYRFQEDDRHYTIVHYRVPEIPKNRVQGDYYFLSSYDEDGRPLDITALSFNAAPSPKQGVRKACIRALKDMRVYSLYTDEKMRQNEQNWNLMVKEDGTFEESYPHFTIEDIGDRWIRCTQNEQNQYFVEASCDRPVYQLAFNIDEMNLSSVTFMDVQDATIWEVERIESFPERGTIEFDLWSEVDNQHIYLSMQYGDPEHLSLEVRDRKGESPPTLYVSQTYYDTGNVGFSYNEPCGEP